MNGSDRFASRVKQDGHDALIPNHDENIRVVSASLRHAGFFCARGRATPGRVAEWGATAEVFIGGAGGVRPANKGRAPVARRHARELRVRGRLAGAGGG